MTKRFGNPLIYEMMQKIFDLEPITQVPHTGSYIQSYRHLLSYFANKQLLDEADLVRGAHMVYGWMPTILDIYPEELCGISLVGAASLLEVAKERDLYEQELGFLKGLINNSIVGASKLLHFVAPERYAIWDSRIYAFCFGRKGWEYQINSVAAYIAYINNLNDLKQDPRFENFHRSVIAKVGYPISGLRALELIMFLRSPQPRQREQSL